MPEFTFTHPTTGRRVIVVASCYAAACRLFGAAPGSRKLTDLEIAELEITLAQKAFGLEIVQKQQEVLSKLAETLQSDITTIKLALESAS